LGREGLVPACYFFGFFFDMLIEINQSNYPKKIGVILVAGSFTMLQGCIASLIEPLRNKSHIN